MKRVLSMLVVLAMVLSMVPSVFAASETATVLTDISEIAVNLTEENGYAVEYSWTPAEDGELSLYQYTDLPINMMLTQGENTADNYVVEDGVGSYSFAVSLEVVAGEEVTIEFINSVVLAQEFTAYGNFVGLPGKSESNPISLEELESTVTNSGKLWYQGFFSGTTMTVTGEGDFTVTYNGVDTAAVEGVVSMDVTSMNPRMPVIFALTGEGEYKITFTYPVGTQMNPEVIFRPAYIPVNIEAGNSQGYFYKWQSNAAGELKITCPTVEGVQYDVTLTNMNTYAQATLQESTDGTVSIAVDNGHEVQIVVAALPDENWNIPALSTALTGEFIYPVGTQMNPEIIFRPAYIPVNIAEGNNQGYFYKWTSNADGELKLTCPTVEGVKYDVNMTNMSTYAQAWLQDSTDGTITLAVKAGDEVVIQVAALPDENWNIPALSTALTGEFIYPVGTQMNPEIIFRPAYIPVNIAEGNNQGYFYKWTSNADGELKLTCPTVEGVKYDVNMTNMSTYAQAWLQDSTDGTITLAVKAGDEVVIQVAALPDENWNTPALQTALTGEFIFPQGSMMNPQVLEELNWYYGEAVQAEGDTDGYYYTWTAPAEGTATFYFGYNEGLENYVLDIVVTNQNTYAQKSLRNDGVDNYGMELQIPVAAGDELMIQVVAIEDAEGKYAPAATMTWCGNFAYPAGSEQNPIVIEWNWDDAYANAAASVTVEAGKTVYFNGTAGMILTVNGQVTEMDEAGVFSIANNAETEATYALALATPLGAYSNPEKIEALPFEDTNSLEADGSYYYVYKVTENGKVTLTVTNGANITVDVLTYSADSEWPISEQFVLAEPEIDENWNYTGWIVADKLVIDVVAGQELKIQVNGLTNWSDWTTPAIDYTLDIVFEESGVTGWFLESGKWYYYENGVKATNKWVKDSTGWCYMGADGSMAYSSWIKDSTGWRYVNAKGYMVMNGWVKDTVGWCYLGADGYMLTEEWVKDSHGWCWVDASGRMVYNRWIANEGKWYFVDANGYRVHNAWKKDSVGWCYLGSDGVMLTNAWAKDSHGWCYLGADGRMVTNGWVKDSTDWCYLGADGYMVTNAWAKDSQGWYWMGADGYAIKNTSKTINGKRYEFNASGICTNP